ncbi:MFS transporter [Mycoplasmatota bacterium WC44]
MIKKYMNLPKPLYALFAGIFLMNLGNYIWALFALMKESHYGLKGTETAFVLGIVLVLNSLGSVIGGGLVDKYNKVRIFTFSLVLSGVFYFAAGFLDGYSVLGAIFIGSFFAAIGTQAVKPLMIDYCETEEERRLSFSLRYICLNAGYTIGPLIGGILLDKGLVKFLFIGDGLTTALYGFVVFLFIKDLREKNNEVILHKNETEYHGSIIGALINRPVIIIILLATFFNIITFRYLSFGLPSYIQSLYDNAGLLYGILSAINGLVAALFTPIVLSITRKLSSGVNLLVGFLIYSGGVMLTLMIEKYYLLIVCMFVFTIGEILLTINSQVFSSEHTPVNFRGRFNSLTTVTFQLGSFTSVYIMSYLFSLGSYKLGIFLIGLAPLVSFMLISGVLISDKVKNKKQLDEIKM